MDLETWVRGRVAGAIEAGEVPNDVLTALDVWLNAAREMRGDGSVSDRLEQLAAALGMPVKQTMDLLDTFGALSPSLREPAFRALVELWLEECARARRPPSEQGERRPGET